MDSRPFIRISLPIAFTIMIATSAIGQQEYDNKSDSSDQTTFNPSLIFETYGNRLKPKGYFLDSTLNDLNLEHESIKISQFQRWEKLESLLMTGESSGFTKINIDPGILHGLLTAEGEMAYRPTNDFDPEEGYRNYRPQMYRINLIGKLLGFEYGAKYLSVDKDFERLQGINLKADQARREIWVSRNFGVFEIKTFLSDYWDNVDFNPSRPRIRNKQGGASLDIAIPSWPLLGLSYKRGTTLTTRRPDGSDRKSADFQTTDGYLYYGRSKWDLTLYWSYYLSTDSIESDSKSKIANSGVSGSYHLRDSFKIEPSLDFTTENYEWLGGGAKYNTPTASLSFSYKPSDEPLSFVAKGSYSRYKGNDGYTDSNTLNGSGEITWNLGKTILGDQSISLSVGYYHYLDTIYSSSSFKEFSAQVAYKMATF
jgi:hypothetical protein